MPETVPPAPLSIRLFGGMAAETPDGSKAPALPRKGWALLAYLAAAPGAAHPRDRLAEILWPGLPLDAARNNLRQVLLTVQRALNDKGNGVPCLEADRQTLRFNAGTSHRFDLLAFSGDLPECRSEAGAPFCAACIARMEETAGLYAGEFLAGLDLPDCPEFEDWLQIQREALLRRQLILLERLSACHERQGEMAQALAFAQRFADLDPWNEEGQRRLMRLFARSGQRGAALGQYDNCRRFLRRELGVQPEAETRILAERIRGGDLAACRPGREAETTGAPPPVLATERRQVTVLYCQIAAPEIDDPDEILDRLHAPQARCARIIRQFFGHVVRTNDGGLLAYFGYPEAREHAAHLAVRAGLALAEERFPELDLRVGIHTGLVITSGDPNLPDTIGRTSGRAVQLRALAAPGQAIVSDATQRLVAGYFDWQPMDNPEAFRAVRGNGVIHRLDAAVSLTPFTGRNDEITAITHHWETARAGTRGMLLLTGDPGIGKSRLVAAAKQEAVAGNGLVRELTCLPEYSQTPFHPLVGMYEDLLGFGPQDPPEARFGKLAAYAEDRYPAKQAGEIVPLLADLLSLPVAAPYTRSEAPLRTQRERIMRFFAGQMATLAANRPALVVIEDLHWCDPTTLELLSRVISDPAPLPIFLLLTTRPEFQPPWPESEVPVLRLAPLADADIQEMIGALAPEMPAETARRIVVRADGVPLFAEELARTVAAAGPDRRDAVPATLQDLLAARLDSIAEAKGAAQLAATIGRDFPLALLRELSAADETALRDSLRRLRETGLVTPTSDDTFQFRHALFQEAAYRSQTKADRTAAHRRIAETLEARFRETVRTQPEILARHWAAAAEAETAIGYWLRAGRMANLRCAHKEAISHFTAALALTETLPGEQQRIQWEFELQVGLGAANFAAEGYGSAPGGTAYARAVDLGERHTGNPDLFPALWGYWACTSSRADYDESLTLTLRLLDMGMRSGDPIQLQQGHFAVGNIRFWRGEFEEARRHLEQAMALYRPEHHETLAANFGENAYATSGGYLCCVLAMMGLPEQALAVRDRTLAEARRIDHPFSLGYALIFAAIVECLLRRPREALPLAEETIALAERHGFPLWDVGGTAKKGWALARLGHAEGAELARYGAASVPNLMSGIRVIFLENLADTLCHLGRHDETLGVIAEARDVMERINDRHVEADLHRLEGECLRGVADTQAEACFERALEISRKQGARLQELRAATGLAALWRDRGRPDDARRLLADVCEGFPEGHDMPDFVEARQLLEIL